MNNSKKYNAQSIENQQKINHDNRVILLFQTLHEAGYIIRLKVDKNRVVRHISRVGGVA
jgi:hypothetical protein